MTDILKGPVKKSISGINNEIVIFFSRLWGGWK